MAPDIRIRQATTGDVFALRHLAALDDRPALKGDALVAEEQGELRAAIELGTGRVVANPFARTADIVGLLRSWREHVTAQAA